VPKVLIVTDILATGGAERQLCLLVRHLPATWDCRVWSIENGPYAAELQQAGIVLYLAPRRWRWDITPAFSLWHLIRAWRPDIIHSYGWMATMAALPLCKWIRIPLVDGTIRRASARGRRERFWLWTLRYGDRVIANSEAGLKACQIDSGRGRVIYNGFDPARLPLCITEENTDNFAAPFTVVMAARMHPVKDYDSFFQAARNLTSKEPQAWQFIAVGDGPTYNTLTESAADLTEKNVMSFIREEMEVLPFVRQANVGVLLTNPSGQEGCSNSIMEYMACGLPLVCTDSGGNRELVLEGNTGFIVPAKDVNALVDRLQWLKDHPKEAQAMGMAGRQRLLKEYSMEKLVEKTLSVYAELLPSADRNIR
jgi:glycosyltransferase involved in cell wall biosynthesis